MSVSVRVPTVLRKHTEGESAVDASGTTVGQVLEDIDQRFPGFKQQVVGEDGRLHRFINLYVNDEDVRFLQSLDTQVRSGDTVSILPAVAGG